MVLECEICSNILFTLHHLGQPNVSIYQGQHSLEIIIFCHVDSMLTRLNLSSIKSRFYNLIISYVMIEILGIMSHVDNILVLISISLPPPTAVNATLQRLIHQHHEPLPKGKILHTLRILCGH